MKHIKQYNEFLNEGFLDNLNPIKNIWNSLVNKVKSLTNKIKGSIDLNYDFSFNGFTKFVQDYNSGKINIDGFISDNQDIIDNLNSELNEGVIKNIIMLAIVFCLAQSCKKSDDDIVKPSTSISMMNNPVSQAFGMGRTLNAIVEKIVPKNSYGENILSVPQNISIKSIIGSKNSLGGELSLNIMSSMSITGLVNTTNKTGINIYFGGDFTIDLGITKDSDISEGTTHPIKIVNSNKNITYNVNTKDGTYYNSETFNVNSIGGVATIISNNTNEISIKLTSLTLSDGTTSGGIIIKIKK
jgi:hypothetical protein